MLNSLQEYISVEDCKDRYLYKICSRNLSVGVFVKERNGFIGIREKFGSKYLFMEFHWDNGPPYGTVKPTQELHKVPDDIVLKEDLGTECTNCRADVDYSREKRSWFHLTRTECTDVNPCSRSNDLLFQLLKGIQK